MTYRKVESGPTFEILENEDGDSAIKCTRCQKTSYNQEDVENLYCGGCHEYHRIHLGGAYGGPEKTRRGR